MLIVCFLKLKNKLVILQLTIINTNYMKSFVSFPLIIALFFSLQISYAQDFLDDIYIVNINYNPIYSNNNQQDIIDEDVIYEDVISDTLSDYGYDNELDYEDRIMKFHNPHYRFRYCLDYGWHDPYWSNWHYPSWSLNYHSYGHHWGWGLSYGYNWNYPSWTYGWNYPSWAYGWNYPHGYYSASYYNYSGINNWQNNIFYTANNNISGHRDPSNPYISSKPSIGQNTERTEGKKRDIVSQIRPGTNKNVQKPNRNDKFNSNSSAIQKPNRNNTSKKPNNFVNKITDQIINSSKYNTNRNTNSNKNNNRNNNFNSNRSNSRSSSPNRSSNNRSRRN
ncbi:MAG: hypothetical protein CMP62_05705 [Flavobacteriales bacterium]|nr:hypothetical protein [Flavobacteriales bacterium]|tara:strand:+ start:3706 stop:4710 length:1005 start_codon:yes stop_codon:yes gene_type:complete